jgi:hypothetical protein
VLYEIITGYYPWEIEGIDNYNDLKILVVDHQKRPKIPNENEYDEVSKFFIKLIKLTWDHDINKRPNISTIYDILLKNRNKKRLIIF